MRNRPIYMAMALFLVMGSACGDDDDNDQTPEGGGTDGGTVDAADNGGDGGDAGESEEEALCGNGEEDENEECDDGNLRNEDGCTILCTYTCVTDEECNDLNECNGAETCNEDHMCDASSDLKDGTDCGYLRVCWKGICVPEACGDGMTGEEEECDDGDLDDTNGCTTECKYSCVADDPERDCSEADPCSGAGICNMETHICGGTPLAEESDCTVVSTGEAGWCKNNVCVPILCGDGIPQSPPEECDLGDENGKPGSTCSIDCVFRECGNGRIEADEQCDDGGNEIMDGCDAECNAELIYRLRNVQVLREPAPDFCEYPGKNRFAESYGELLIPVLDTLNYVNGLMNARYNTGEMNPLIAIDDSSDLTMQTRDEDMAIVLLDGVPDATWEPPAWNPMAGTGFDYPPLDFPFKILPTGGWSDSGEPLRALPAEQSGAGRVVTTETADLAIASPFGTNWEFKDANFRLIFDVDNLSKPKEPPQTADSVRVPERIDVENDIPTGIMCGVQPISSLENTPIDVLITFYCCKADGSPFIPCGPEQEECDSMADIVENGCNLCTSVTLAEAILGVANGTLTALDLTAECTPGCQGIPLTLGIEPDVDLDGDGINDGYTTVMAFEGMRIHPRGMAEEPTD